MLTFIDCDNIEKHESHDYVKKEIVQIQRYNRRYYSNLESVYRCRGVCDCNRRQEIHGPGVHQ